MVSIAVPRQRPPAARADDNEYHSAQKHIQKKKQIFRSRKQTRLWKQPDEPWHGIDAGIVNALPLHDG